MDGSSNADNEFTSNVVSTPAGGDDVATSKSQGGKSQERREYHMGVLRHVQLIFAHLACSKLQYYVPRGFWKHFRSVLHARVRDAALLLHMYC